MKIYTKTGDAGETSLIGGERVSKADVRIDSYGTVDELNSILGVAAAAKLDDALDGEIHAIQRDLFELGALLASNDHSRFPGPGDDRITALEASIDRMESSLEPLRNFILPGGSMAAAQLHVARTVCRRAERLVVALENQDEAIIRGIRYLNRLSDYLFVAARYTNRQAGVGDVPWVR